MSIAVLYRGPLSSCNYDCHYCPFAKRRENAAELARDRAALERFVACIAARTAREWQVFFTPWGEALTRRWYRAALAALSRMPHVRRAAVQTNLSCPPSWLADAEPTRIGIWATYHPTEIALDRFVRNALAHQSAGVSISVGAVGIKEHFPQLAALRAALPASIYMWVNAYKRIDHYYSPAEIELLTRMDPWFPLNNRRHPSFGRACATGEEVFAVDGAGAMRRCHFVAEPIGDFYADDWAAALRPRPCPNATCGCHIGYVHLRELDLRAVYGEGLLERVPRGAPGLPILALA